MKRVLFAVSIILLLFFPANANADEHEGFIVKINESQRSLLFALPSGIEEIGQNKGVYFAETLDDIERLKMLGDIEYIEPNYEVMLLGLPNDEYYAEQTNLHMIKAENAWNIGCYGNDIKIGVIDSGVYHHPDLTGNILPGYNYYDGNTDTLDVNGHGTFVSGLIAAQSNEIGIVGVAHKAKIVPLKCFGTGMNSDLKAVVDAIYGAIDDYDCEIINMSLGLTDNPDSLAEAIDYAVSKNAVIVAAVGNDGNDTMYYPAGYHDVIGVGSVNDDKNVSRFSQRNASVFVTAPGNAVIGLSIDGDYRISKGTSLSTPLVTGAIAIAKCIDEFMNADEAKTWLIASLEDNGEPKYDVNYGYGIINIQALIDKMLEDIELFVSPLDKNGNKYSVNIYNNSGRENSATSFFASYIENKLIETNISSVRIPAGQSVNIDFEPVEIKVTHFLWSDLDTLNPLYKMRQIN